jgi:hypothetical protein
MLGDYFILFFYVISIRYSDLLGLRFRISPGARMLCLVSDGCQIEVSASG